MPDPTTTVYTLWTRHVAAGCKTGRWVQEAIQTEARCLEIGESLVMMDQSREYLVLPPGEVPDLAPGPNQDQNPDLPAA
jgi:hypothetical protein